MLADKEPLHYLLTQILLVKKNTLPPKAPLLTTRLALLLPNMIELAQDFKKAATTLPLEFIALIGEPTLLPPQALQFTPPQKVLSNIRLH